MEEQPCSVCGLIGTPRHAIIPRPSPDGYRSGEITIDSSGRVFVQQVELGKLRLVSFAAGTRLEAIGGNLLRSDQQPKVNAGSATVLQAMLELSNVQPTIEMSRLAELNRSYEVASKLLKDSQDINEISKLANVPE